MTTPSSCARPPLLGLIGRARTGKDTAARFLADFGFARYAFADPLREAALGLDPIVDARLVYGDPGRGDDLGQASIVETRLSLAVRLLGWDAAKEAYPEVRRTLQRLGTESVRALDETFWVRALAARLDAETGPAVVTDVRFPNEADLIRSRGGLIVRVTRPHAPATLAHSSESALDRYDDDVVLANTGSLDDFRATVRAFARTI
jgi:dephospho-CoA kinase